MSQDCQQQEVKSCYIIFYYFVDFTHQPFSPKLIPLQSGLSPIVYLKKWGRKCLPHSKSIPRGFAFMQWFVFLCCSSQEHIFMLYYKKGQQWAYFFVVLWEKQCQLYFWCCKKGWQLFYVILQGREQYNNSTIARCKGKLQGCDDNTAHATIKLLYAVDCNDDGNMHIFYIVLQEATTTIVDCNKGVQDCAKETTNQIFNLAL
jgi:hypothetical protein